jgi:hypothetical protein
MNNIRTEITLSDINDFAELGLISDPHFGASSQDPKALKKDFDRMKGCLIGINGDVFDAILPSDLKRFDLRAVDPELLKICDELGMVPLNAAVELAARFLEPYAHQIVWIGQGNHEAHVSKRHHVSLIPMLIAVLNERTGSKIQYGGWCGYWHITLSRFGKRSGFTIYRHHGAGGSAPVTGGVIDFKRMMTWQMGVDALWIGHKHNRFHVIDRKMGYVPERNETVEKDVHCIMTGSYLDTYGIAPGTKPSYAEGWNLSPQSKGGAIIRLGQGEEIVHGKRKMRTISSVTL